MSVNYVKMVYEGTHWHQYSAILNAQLNWLENKLGPRGVMEIFYKEDDFDSVLYTTFPIEELAKRPIYEGSWFWLWIGDTAETNEDNNRIAYFIFVDNKIAAEFKLRFG